MDTLMKILVIDDDPSMTNMLGLILKSASASVIAANSGTDGVRLTREQSPDLIILDIMMPDMDGSSVAHEMKDDPDTCNIPVIFLTGAVKASEVPKSHKIGGQYFLAKPFRAEELLKMLEIVLSG